MWKLISDYGHWSFLDGYHIFGNVVWLMNKDEVRKYRLLDDDYNPVDINVQAYLVPCEYYPPKDA